MMSICSDFSPSAVYLGTNKEYIRESIAAFTSDIFQDIGWIICHLNISICQLNKEINKSNLLTLRGCLFEAYGQTDGGVKYIFIGRSR